MRVSGFFIVKVLVTKLVTKLVTGGLRGAYWLGLWIFLLVMDCKGLGIKLSCAYTKKGVKKMREAAESSDVINERKEAIIEEIITVQLRRYDAGFDTLAESVDAIMVLFTTNCRKLPGE